MSGYGHSWNYECRGKYDALGENIVQCPHCPLHFPSKLSRIQTQRDVTGLYLNPLMPTDHYRGRTAPLASKVAFYIFIQQI
jgi:hypothetical protein